MQKKSLTCNDFKFQLKKGQTFVDNNGDIFYYVSYSWVNKTIEIKPIDHVYKSKIGKSMQLFKTINQFFANFKICDCDILGNKYNRKSV